MAIIEAADIIMQNDLLAFADKLEEYLDAIIGDRANRKAMLEKFYTAVAMYCWSWITDENCDKIHIICEEKKAVLEYVCVTKPGLTSPMKTIKALRAYIAEIRDKFVAPSGEVITADEVVAVMKYLDDTYDFTDIVMCNQAPVFAIINQSNRYHNNECVGIQTTKGIQNVFFLYHMNDRTLMEGVEMRKSPVAILFHELGHSLYFKYAGYEERVPESLLSQLEPLAPDLRTIPYKDQCEVLADTFAMGMMKDSPFEQYDPFPLDPQYKAFFKKLVKAVCEKVAQR